MVTEITPADKPVSAADSILPATDSIPEFRSAPSTAQPPMPTTEAEDSARGCTNCGRTVESLHRLKQDDAVDNLCSACILSLHKGMYCCLCFVVNDNSVEQNDPTLWLTCAKCQRMSHLACAHDHNLPTDSVPFTCGDCSKLQEDPIEAICINTANAAESGSLPLKKLQVAIDQQRSLNEALAAAQIVAVLAVKRAKHAKARARALAGVAASAATRAKAALDTAHRVALEEATWKSDSMRRFSGVSPETSRGLPSSSMFNSLRITRADGRVSMPNLSHLYSHSLSCKDQLGKEPATLGYNPRFSAPFARVKTFPPSGEAMKSLSTSQSAFTRHAVFKKPEAVCLQGGLERIPSEGAVVSSSPTSTLEVSRSLDTMCLNALPAGSGSAHGQLESCGQTNSLSMAATESDPSRGKSLVPVSKEQASVMGKGVEDTSISAT